MVAIFYLWLSTILFQHELVVNGQWAQTFGWGGAGNGKRSLGVGLSDTKACQMNVYALKYIQYLLKVNSSLNV